jgi:hypothetical protein
MESNRRGKETGYFQNSLSSTFPGNYIESYTRDGFGQFPVETTRKIKDSAIKTESAKWIKTLLEKIDKEDIKFVQFINIRADYPAYGDTPAEIDSTTEKKYDSYRNGAASSIASVTTQSSQDRCMTK